MRRTLLLLIACSKAPYDPTPLVTAPLLEVGSRAGGHTFRISLPDALVVVASGPAEARWEGKGAVVVVRFGEAANPSAVARTCQDVSDGKLCCEVVGDAALAAWGDKVCRTLHAAT